MSTFTWIGGFPGPYNMTTPSNWSAGGPPGPADIGLLQNTSTIGPYTLTGSLTVGELSVVGDIAALKGSITASGSFATDLAITGGGQFTIASTGNFTGPDIVQVGTTASPGLFVVDGILNTGQVDVMTGGTFEVDAPASVTGDILLDTGTLVAIPTPGTAGSSTVTLGNAVHLLTGGTLAGSGGAALDLTGIIDGGGSIVVNGGSVALSSVNSFTGGVTVAAGTLTAASTALGSGPLTVSGGMLLAGTSETITNAIVLQNVSTLAAAHGQTLTLNGTNNGLGGTIFLGVAGDDGTIVFDLISVGYGNPNYVVQAGTVLDEPYGMIGGYPLTVDAGATFDLAGSGDYTGTLAGSGVITNSGTAALLRIFSGSFAGAINGAVKTDVQSALTLGGTIAASAAGTIDPGATLSLVSGGSIASSMVDNGVLTGVPSGAATVSGAISGSGTVTQVQSSGTLTLSGNDDYTGGTTIEAGRLQIGNGGTSGSIAGDVTDNGILVFDRSDTIGFAGNISGIGSVTQNGSGTLELTGTNAFTGGILLNTGTVELASADSAGPGTITFNAPTTLRLDTNTLPNTIASFGTIGTIDLAALPFTKSSDVVFTYKAPTLDVIHSGTTVALGLPGTFTASSFTALSDQAGGTDIVACFAAGTHIATERGDVPVESLHLGESVRTRLGNSVAPITWIGHRQIDCTRHPTSRRVWPVRVRAGAFGEHRPARDLFLSPDHAVFISDVLIPIKHLINGTTITQLPADAVTYYHVELPRHDVLLAEDLPVESFLPGADKSDFANADGAVRLHPDLVSLKWEADGFAPLVVTGDRLQAVRHYLAERAETLGQRQRKRRRAA